MNHIDEIGGFIVVITLFVTVAWVINVTFNYALKKRLIDQGRIDEVSLQFVNKAADTRYEHIKWGCLLFFGGLGLIVLQFLPYRADESPLPYGVEAIFLSLGFFVYYFISQRRQ